MMAKRGTLDHHKTFLLATALGIPECYALGVLDAIWEWVSKYKQNGDISGVSPSFVARAIHYPDNGDELFRILIEVRFIDKLLDGRLLIHDWAEHSENSVHQYLKNRGELFADGTPPFSRCTRRAKAENADSQTDHKSVVNDSQTDHERVTNDSRQPLPLPLPLPLKPSAKRGGKTKVAIPVRFSDGEQKSIPDQCESIYQAYPKHKDKQAALLAIAKALKKIPYTELLARVECFARKVKKENTEMQFIKHPDKWFMAGSYEDEDLKPPPRFDVVEVTSDEWWGKEEQHGTR